MFLIFYHALSMVFRFTVLFNFYEGDGEYPLFIGKEAGLKILYRANE